MKNKTLPVIRASDDELPKSSPADWQPIITVPLNVHEAWAIIHALAEANRNEPSRFERARRTWIAERLATAIDAGRVPVEMIK
jgi:hypothetical protein